MPQEPDRDEVNVVEVEELVVDTNHGEADGAVEMTKWPGTLQPIRLASCNALCSGVGMGPSSTRFAVSRFSHGWGRTVC